MSPTLARGLEHAPAVTPYQLCETLGATQQRISHQWLIVGKMQIHGKTRGLVRDRRSIPLPRQTLVVIIMADSSFRIYRGFAVRGGQSQAAGRDSCRIQNSADS